MIRQDRERLYLDRANGQYEAHFLAEGRKWYVRVPFKPIELIIAYFEARGWEIICIW